MNVTAQASTASKQKRAARVPQFAWGAVRGQVTLDAQVIEHCRVLAKQYYDDAEANEFAGDDVEDVLIPAWMPSLESWFPTQEIAALGFALNDTRGIRLFATVGVDSHEDDIDGPALILVLHNDGLKFKQGKQQHVTQVGEWFIFNDRLPHEVKSTKRSTTYLILSVPLRALAP